MTWLEPIKEMIGWPLKVGVEWLVGVPAAIVTLILAGRELKPGIKKSTIVLRYIDYAENQLIEEKEHLISWGHFFPKKIVLPKIHRDSVYHFLYKPQRSYKKELNKDYYHEKREGSMWVITLIDKRIFDEAETDCVYVETKTPIRDEAYKEKISHQVKPDCVVITNETLEEIRNYPVSLPTNIDISLLNNAMEFLSGFENPLEGSTEGIKIKIRKIPANHGNNPEVLMIPIRRA